MAQNPTGTELDPASIAAGVLDPTIPGPADQTRVRLDEAWERRWWCKALGCRDAELRQAVSAVGPDVAALKRYFHRDENPL